MNVEDSQLLDSKFLIIVVVIRQLFVVSKHFCIHNPFQLIQQPILQVRKSNSEKFDLIASGKIESFIWSMRLLLFVWVFGCVCGVGGGVFFQPHKRGNYSVLIL